MSPLQDQARRDATSFEMRPSGPCMRPPRIALCLFPGLLLSLFYWDRPEALITSDTMASAEFIWDLLHRGGAWSSFQQPHSPAFIPDDLIFGGVQAMTGSWRVALAVWVFAIIAWLILLGSALAARVAYAGREPATLGFLTVALPILIAAAPDAASTATTGQMFPWFLILLPGQHGGTFLLTLTAAFAVHRALRQPSSLNLVGLTLLCLAAEASDQLSLISLLTPATAAAAGCVLVGRVSKRGAAQVMGGIWGGAAIGWISILPIERQYMPGPTLSYFTAHGARFLAELDQNPGVIVAALVVTAGLAATLWRQGTRGFLSNFWSIFMGASALGSLAFTIMFYEDAWSFRYTHPALWWAVILVAGSLTRLAGRHLQAFRAMAAAIVTGLALIVVFPGFQVPRLFVWTSPLGSCLERQGLRAGLADYWIARKTSMGTDWSAQIEPIDSHGAARIWGNDWLWFMHDIHDAGRRPVYRFIVMDRLPVERIAAVYGRPDRVVRCDDSSIWIYNDPARLFRALSEASPYLAAEFAAAPPLP